MSDNSFVAYILEQLSDLPGITTRNMFGSVGLYYHGIFFGIGVFDDEKLVPPSLEDFRAELVPVRGSIKYFYWLP